MWGFKGKFTRGQIRTPKNLLRKGWIGSLFPMAGLKHGPKPRSHIVKATDQIIYRFI
ncbi:hypothetical protein LINGRAHAP2_LOCUS23102 [Linum grandiflorum]